MKKTDATYLDTVVGRAVALGMLVGGGLTGLLGVVLQSFGAAPALSEDAAVNPLVLNLAALGALAGALINGARARGKVG